MDKTNRFLKRIGRELNNPRYIKPLLILICCLAVLLSGMIVAAGLQARKRRTVQMQQASAEAAEMSAEEPEAVREKLPAVLTAFSSREELSLLVCDADGLPIQGQRFSLSVTYPGGAAYTLETQEDGCCLVSGLPAGEYSAVLLESDNYDAAGPISCQIESDWDSRAAVSGMAVLDENGNPRYRYRVLLGPGGFLLSNITHSESRVLPVDCDGDGVPDYGINCVASQTAADESGRMRTGIGYSHRVRLYREDNSPVSDYAIEAIPITTQSETVSGWQMLDGKSSYYNAYGYRLTGLQRIDGKLYYFDPDGTRARAVGIDISYYNENVDWEAVKEQGIRFAIARIGGRGWSTGSPYGDLRSHEYLMEAQRAGIQVGVYFYSTAINVREAMEEAQFALKELDGIQLDLPIFIDVEFSGDYPKGRADRLTAAERKEIICTFCETVRHAGYRAGIYSGQYFYQRNLYYPALAPYTIWMANYVNYGGLPDFSAHYDIWQFTERGTIAGIPGRVDINVIF